jgi:hypothetical protein
MAYMFRPYDQLPEDGEKIKPEHVEDMYMTVGINYSIVHLLVLHELFTECSEICKPPRLEDHRTK